MKILPFLFLLFTISSYSQQAVPASGGTVSGASGSFSVSVGQAVNGFLQNATHSVSQGVQQTYANYSTQVQAAQCGTVLTNLNTIIIADAIVGATKYRFEVTNGSTVRTIEAVTNSFTLAQLSGGACFSTAYVIRVAVQYGSVWYDYGTSCTVTTPDLPPTASAQTLCGSATVANLTATGTAIKWYTSATGGTALVTTTILTTGTYYASQTINGCESGRTSVTVTVIPTTTPIFNQVGLVCTGTTLTPLPITSTNGITGTWSPAINNTTTTLYTFTPTAGQCATTTTQTITITSPFITSPISFVSPAAALPSVTIGTQVWTNKNLDVTTYRDGTPIPQVTDPTAWANLTTGAWCYYDNDPANGAVYGKLYNWYAVAGIHDNDPNTPNKILAPTGWHVPSDGEWTSLVQNLDPLASASNLFGSLQQSTIAGGKMKEMGTVHWISPNNGATNSSGFTALPAGWRYPWDFGDIRGFTYFWTSTINNNALGNYVWLRYDESYVHRQSNTWNSSGFSVRCLKD